MDRNFQNTSLLCRLCAEAPGTIGLWNHDKSNYNCDILSTIKNHLFIQLIEEDPVCGTCLDHVKQWDEFFSKCQLAQGKLKKMIEMTKHLQESKDELIPTDSIGVAAAASELLAVPHVPDPISLNVTIESESQFQTSAQLDAVINNIESSNLIKINLPEETSCELQTDQDITEKRKMNKSKLDKKLTKKNKDEDEAVCGSGGRIPKAILTFEQVGEKLGRVLTSEEAKNVHNWIENKNNRQLFKFVFGHGDDRIWSCHVCQQKVCGRYTELRRHCYEEHHSKLMYSCELCFKKFTYIRLYKRHLEKHFNSNSNVEHDKTEVAPQPSGSFICEICGKVLKQKNCLIKHMLTHLPEDRKNVHFCEVCGKGFPALGMLTSHKNRVHIEGRPYQCKTCGKAYKTQRSWKDHCEAHLGNRVFICTVCGMKLSSRQCLKLHTLTHTGEKPFTCDVCGRDYHSKSRMLRHKRITHNPNPQFICDICGKAFRSRTGIEGHKLEHTGEVPNVCPICGKAIRAKSNFYAHLKVHRQQASREAAGAAGDQSNIKRRSKKQINGTQQTMEQDYTFHTGTTDHVVDPSYINQQPHLLSPMLTSAQSVQPALLYESDRFDVDCVSGNVPIYSDPEQVTTEQYTFIAPRNSTP